MPQRLLLMLSLRELFEVRLGMSALEVKSIVEKLKVKGITTLEEFSDQVSLQLCRDVGIEPDFAPRVVLELLMERTSGAESPSSPAPKGGDIRVHLPLKQIPRRFGGAGKIRSLLATSGLSATAEQSSSFSLDSLGAGYLQLAPDEAIPDLMFDKSGVVLLKVVHRMQVGKLYKALFVPSLTFVAVHYVPVANSCDRTVVSHYFRQLNPVKQVFVLPFSEFPSGTKEIDPVLKLKADELKTCPVSPLPLPIVPLERPLYLASFWDTYIDHDLGGVCCVSEYYSGGSLQDQLDRGIRFTESDLSVIAYSVLKGLQTLHSTYGVRHGNLSPSTMLTNQSGNVVITGRGISPSLVKGLLQDDVWALGISLITMMSTAPSLTLASALSPHSRKGFVVISAQFKAGQQLDPSIRAGQPLLHQFLVDCLKHDDAGAEAGGVSTRPSVDQLLQSPFISEAIRRGVVCPPQVPRIKAFIKDHVNDAEVGEVVEAALSWQLDRLEERKRDKQVRLRASGGSCGSGGSGSSSAATQALDLSATGSGNATSTLTPAGPDLIKLPRYGKERIVWLAKQLGVDWRYIFSAFEQRSSEIDELLSTLKSSADSGDPSSLFQLGVITGGASSMASRILAHLTFPETPPDPLQLLAKQQVKKRTNLATAPPPEPSSRLSFWMDDDSSNTQPSPNNNNEDDGPSPNVPLASPLSLLSPPTARSVLSPHLSPHAAVKTRSPTL